MAVFGSGMRKEYAFFGYEGDFVRSRDGFLRPALSSPPHAFALPAVRHDATLPPGEDWGGCCAA